MKIGPLLTQPVQELGLLTRIGDLKKIFFLRENIFRKNGSFLASISLFSSFHYI